MTKEEIIQKIKEDSIAISSDIEAIEAQIAIFIRLNHSIDENFFHMIREVTIEANKIDNFVKSKVASGEITHQEIPNEMKVVVEFLQLLKELEEQDKQNSFVSPITFDENRARVLESTEIQEKIFKEFEKLLDKILAEVGSRDLTAEEKASIAESFNKNLTNFKNNLRELSISIKIVPASIKEKIGQVKDAISYNYKQTGEELDEDLIELAEDLAAETDPAERAAIKEDIKNIIMSIKTEFDLGV
jgi:hypothetical protein